MTHAPQNLPSIFLIVLMYIIKNWWRCEWNEKKNSKRPPNENRRCRRFLSYFWIPPCFIMCSFRGIKRSVRDCRNLEWNGIHMYGSIFWPRSLVLGKRQLSSSLSSGTLPVEGEAKSRKGLTTNLVKQFSIYKNFNQYKRWNFILKLRKWFNNLARFIHSE